MTIGGGCTSNERDAGFSLVEVLVVLILVSVMAGAMTMMTGQFRRLIDASDRNGEQLALQAVTRHVTRLIEQAEAMPVAMSTASEAFYLSGASNQIRFVAVVRLGATTQGLRTVSFEISKDGDLLQIMSFRRQLADGGVIPAAAEAVVAEQVLSIKFSYFGLASDEMGKPGWQNVWNATAKLPLAVAVTVTKTAKGQHLLSASEVAWLARP